MPDVILGVEGTLGSLCQQYPGGKGIVRVLQRVETALAWMFLYPRSNSLAEPRRPSFGFPKRSGNGTVDSGAECWYTSPL